VGPTSAGSSPADAGSSTASNGSGNGSTQPDAGTTTGSTGSGSTGSTGGTATTQTSGTADATQLPAATTAQIPLTAEYDALNVPALAAGATYKDPTTGVKIYKISSSSFPASSPTWNHDYSEGGDEISLPYNGDDKTRAVLMRDATSAFWLVDFTPGAGVGNARKLTGSGNPSPFMDLAFAFSSNPATPYYAYVSDAAAIRRIDIRTGAEAPGNNWPQTGETYGTWLHQSANDGLFVWMRGSTGGVVVMFEPSTGTKKVYTNEGINEPRIDRGGRYVAMNMNAGNAMQVYDFQAGAISWSMGGDPGIPFAPLDGRRLERDVSGPVHCDSPGGCKLAVPLGRAGERHARSRQRQLAAKSRGSGRSVRPLRQLQLLASPAHHRFLAGPGRNGVRQCERWPCAAGSCLQQHDQLHASGFREDQLRR